MDSPEASSEATPPNASSVSPSSVQDSPFLTYLSNLSPIKLKSGLHAPSAIRELSFPSPAPVFTSPHDNPVRKDKVCKRAQLLSPSSGIFSCEFTRNSEAQLERVSQSPFIRCSTKNQTSQLQSCSSPSVCIDDFFADPVEDCVNSQSRLGSSKESPEASSSICQEEDKETEQHVDKFLPLRHLNVEHECSDAKEEPSNTNELCMVESLLLASETEESFEADNVCTNNNEGLFVNNIHSRDAAVMEVDGVDEAPISNDKEALIPVDSSVDASIILVGNGQSSQCSSISPEQNKSDSNLDEERPSSSKSKRVGCQVVYAMRRRLEFENSLSLEAQPQLINDLANPRSPQKVDQIITEAESLLTVVDPAFCNQHYSSANTISKRDDNSSIDSRPSCIGLHLNSLGTINRDQTSMFNDSLKEKQPENLSEGALPPVSLSHFETPCSTKTALIETCPKRMSKNSPDSGGCKRCNCKRSKCLKLYCECFAAGVYCTDSCSCVACLNRPEHEAIVMETRQQIQSRNPLAFAPKVVIQETSATARSSAVADKNTPASARHKKGCNCKKSQCLKKYCECFQSGVGCSIGCRCEGCKNTFGTREASLQGENILNGKACNEKRGFSVVEDKEEPRSAVLFHLSPLTPLVNWPNGVNLSKSQLLIRSYRSPESAAPSERNTSEDETDVSFADSFIVSPEAKVNTPPVQRSTPMTPAHNYGQTRLAIEWSSAEGGTSNSCDDHGTPEILLRADSLVGNRPKVGSPNKKKRVSPPYIQGEGLAGIVTDGGGWGSTKSTKSRKFILHSVPTFPSLTPYSNVCKTQPP